MLTDQDERAGREGHRPQSRGSLPRQLAFDGSLVLPDRSAFVEMDEFATSPDELVITELTLDGPAGPVAQHVG